MVDMEKTMTGTERLVQNRESVFREEEDGAFLFDPVTGNLKFLNNMGVNVYQLCDGARTVRDITSLVADQYKDTPREQIESDIAIFLTSLVDMTFLIPGLPDD